MAKVGVGGRRAGRLGPAWGLAILAAGLDGCGVPSDPGAGPSTRPEVAAVDSAVEPDAAGAFAAALPPVEALRPAAEHRWPEEAEVGAAPEFTTSADR